MLTQEEASGDLPLRTKMTRKLVKNASRNSQFDFALIKLRKFEFPHQQTTWMMLTCLTWLVSPNLLSKFELEVLYFSLAFMIANF